ncbi:substrate-binding domain-containing protein [Roseobacter ponti]|uniref:LacI family DNA-binding transcriptional regulator n=1 Tax=Roseobacter ponti TaxID=1891787 RepID=A0A858SXL3_9RHOB|nr:substrate-binding domain-containing protein [Roseobacter ponti]QJF51616.1 LacI family DNA-binding transcriptional regulator [Roseobacter ponti]
MNLKELSQQLNLSQTTVSRALNGYPEVNEITRRRVTDAAEKFNYRPNRRALTLATGKSMSIGHIIPVSRRNEIVNIVFADFIAGAGEVYSLNGYNMTLSVVPDAQEFEAYRTAAETGAVDGIILQSPTREDPRIPHLAALNIPFLVHGRATAIEQPYSWLDVNNLRAFEVLTGHLLSLGHRRIGFINGQERLDFALRRRAGYLSALKAAGVAADPDLMTTGEMSEQNGFAAAQAMLAGAHPPTAFITSSVVPALGVRRAAAEAGLRLGRDLSLACFDDDISFLPNGGARPVFTAMRSSVRDAGRRCAEMLIEQIRSPDGPPRTELWEAALVSGSSTGPCPAKD